MTSGTHTLNKAKAEEALHKRGWKRGVAGTWVIPISHTNVQIEQDWNDALLEAIECPLEEQLEQNKEFVKKHPTSKR